MSCRSNKKLILLVLLLLVLPLSACSTIDISAAKSHGIDVEWHAFFGGVRGDRGRCIDLTSDGGYILTGGTSSYESSSGIWLIKTDADGNELWNKRFGDDASGYYVQQTTDGGYILVGDTSSFYSFQRDVLLIKTDADGNETWSKVFDGGDTDAMYCVIQATDGGYIMAGHTDSDTETDSWDIWLIKTDDDGNELWSKTFGGEGLDVGYHVQQTADGGYILVGETNPYAIGGEPDAWLIKTDADGNELWNKTFGGTSKDVGYCVQQTADGGYVIEGATGSYGGSYGEGGGGVAWLIKTDANGNEIWSRTYNDFKDGSFNILGKNFIQQTSDGGYIISGLRDRENSHYEDGFIMKTDTEGNYLWHIILGASKGGYASCVRETSDGGYIVTGYIAKQPWIWETCNIDQINNTDCVLVKIGAGS